MITEKLNSNDINLTFIPTSKSDLMDEIENLFKKYFPNVSPTLPNSDHKSKFGDLDWFINANPKKPAKATVYSNICTGKIPSSLIHKAEGTKNVLFYKERVLDWINQGFPKDYQPKAEE
jgi:hypothetical protein